MTLCVVGFTIGGILGIVTHTGWADTEQAVKECVADYGLDYSLNDVLVVSNSLQSLFVSVSRIAILYV